VKAGRQKYPEDVHTRRQPCSGRKPRGQRHRKQRQFPIHVAQKTPKNCGGAESSESKDGAAPGSQVPPENDGGVRGAQLEKQQLTQVNPQKRPRSGLWRKVARNAPQDWLVDRKHRSTEGTKSRGGENVHLSPWKKKPTIRKGPSQKKKNENVPDIGKAPKPRLQGPRTRRFPKLWSTPSRGRRGQMEKGKTQKIPAKQVEAEKKRATRTDLAWRAKRFSAPRTT